MQQDVVLRMENITKRFPGVLALDHVSLELRRGEIHAIMGVCREYIDSADNLHIIGTSFEF